MEKYQKSNFYSMVAEGGLFQISNKFWDTSTVIPLFITAYAGSMTVVGLALTLSMFASVLVTFIFGLLVWKIKNLARFQFFILLIRGLPLFLAPVVLFAPSMNTAVLSFLVVFTICNGSIGIIGVSWWDIMARTIPQENRGQLLGLQQVSAGIGGLITGIAIKEILGSNIMSDPVRFSILFTGVGAFGLVSALVMGRVKDPYRKQMQPSGNPFIYIRSFSRLLHINPKYCRILFMQVFQYALFFTFPFLILFEKQYFSLHVGQVSTLVFLQIVGTLTGGLVWGKLSKRWGNSGVIRAALFLSLLLMLLVLFCIFGKNQQIPVPYAILVMISLLAGTCQLAFLYSRNYIIDVTDEENRAIYLVMNSTLLFPLSFISLISGIIIDHFGFLPIFSAGALATLICLYFAKGLLSVTELPAWQEELTLRLTDYKEK